ncbi:MarR family winged helix-turn-helix transcriptional regulator [Mucilaginibacter flavus]|uniref:MarR family winged helix-turn-helix transcriptional regulator n=1 Tax=Mucilaginibacter flavus TaxID=931504 RepID=UPI0025B4A6B4|nr:winged helix DNA-binding protein [Mucilaginibacter flavus]MDN3584579.1 winged helix DNA-binding protein [Mucilaginibacter flavus]
MESENEGRDLSLVDLAGFLNNSLSVPPSSERSNSAPFGNNDAPTLQVAVQLDNNIGRLITFLSRYAKFYIKKAIEGTPLLAVEDFSCLGILMTHEYLSQAELITLNVQENTSGVQVIRRLIDAGLVQKSDDPQDKRAKRISITDNGRKTLQMIFRDMKDVGKIVTGSLTEQEKITMLYLLQKMEHFHKHHYEAKTFASKSDIHQKSGEITL